MDKIEKWPADKLRVFLGGTSVNGAWREALISMLNPGLVAAFNPIVEVWDDAAAANERLMRSTSTHNVYVLTPLMQGFYSIAELTEDSIKCPGKTIFYFMEKEVNLEDGKTYTFEARALTSIQRLGELAMSNGAKQCHSLEEIAYCLNQAGLAQQGILATSTTI